MAENHNLYQCKRHGCEKTFQTLSERSKHHKTCSHLEIEKS